MELYMVCVLMAIALSMVIFKGIQAVLSIVHPLPSDVELGIEASKKMKQAKQKKVKEKKQKPRGKRPPRNVRLEQIYSGSPISFDELDTTYGRRSAGSNRGRPSSRYDDYTNGSNGREVSIHHQTIPLEQMSFVEDIDEDPIEAYVQQQHQRIMREVAAQSPNRSSTPIQSYYTRPSGQVYPKNHDTIV